MYYLFSSIWRTSVRRCPPKVPSSVCWCRRQRSSYVPYWSYLHQLAVATQLGHFAYVVARCLMDSNTFYCILINMYIYTYHISGLWPCTFLGTKSLQQRPLRQGWHHPSSCLGSVAQQHQVRRSGDQRHGRCPKHTYGFWKCIILIQCFCTIYSFIWFIYIYIYIYIHTYICAIENMCMCFIDKKCQMVWTFFWYRSV